MSVQMDGKAPRYSVAVNFSELGAVPLLAVKRMFDGCKWTAADSHDQTSATIRCRISLHFRFPDLMTAIGWKAAVFCVQVHDGS